MLKEKTCYSMKRHDEDSIKDKMKKILNLSRSLCLYESQWYYL